MPYAVGCLDFMGQVIWHGIGFALLGVATWLILDWLNEHGYLE